MPLSGKALADGRSASKIGLAAAGDMVMIDGSGVQVRANAPVNHELPDQQNQKPLLGRSVRLIGRQSAFEVAQEFGMEVILAGVGTGGRLAEFGFRADTVGGRCETDQGAEKHQFAG